MIPWDRASLRAPILLAVLGVAAPSMGLAEEAPVGAFGEQSAVGPARVKPAPAPVREGIRLSEQEALAFFFQRNLNLIAARFDVEYSRAEEIAAAAMPNPVVGVDEFELSRRMNWRGAVGGLGPATIVRIDQLIETMGKRQLRREKSALGREAAEHDFQDAVRLFSNAVRRSFHQLLLSQYIVELAEGQAKRFDELLAANKSRLHAGDISESDFLRIEVEGLKARADLDHAQADRQAAVADLAVLLAWPEEAHRFIATGDWPSFPEPVDLDDEAVLLARALGERPDVAARHKRLAQAEKGLTLARRSRIPDVTVSAGFAHDPSNNVLDTGLIGLSVPLPIFYQNQGEIGRAQVDVSNAELAANQRAQQVQGELAIALARWKGAKSVAQRYSSEILRRVTQVREVAEFAYHRGATSIIDLIQAERDYKNTVQEYHRAMANRTLAYLDLVAVLGGQAPDATGPTSTTEPDLLPARGPSLRDNAQSFLPARQTRTMRQDQREKTR